MLAILFAGTANASNILESNEQDDLFNIESEFCIHSFGYDFNLDNMTVSGIYDTVKVETFLNDFWGDYSAILLQNGETVTGGVIQEGMLAQIFYRGNLMGKYTVVDLIATAQIAEEYFENNPMITPLNQGNAWGFTLPIDGMNFTTSISSGFRPPTRPNHQGIDIVFPGRPGAIRGTPARAVRRGTAHISRQGGTGAGNWVRVTHGTINGIRVETRYLHLDRHILGAVGSTRAVTQGQSVGPVGNSGAEGTSNAHLHFEIRVNGNPVNPIANTTTNPTLQGAPTFNPATYRIRYIGNGAGAQIANLPASQTKSHGVPIDISNTVPTHSGYWLNFDGNGGTRPAGQRTNRAQFMWWATNRNGTGDRFHPNDRYTRNANLTLYAFWSYPVAGVLPNSTRTGHAFAGWFTSATGGRRITQNDLIRANNTTLFAGWIADRFTVTLNPNGGTGGTASVTATFGQAMPAIIPPTRIGHIFQGYFDTAAATDGTRFYNANGTSARNWDRTGNQTLWARWTAQTFGVNLDRNGGTTGSTIITTVFNSSTIFGYATPTRVGHTFNGYWTAASGGHQVINPSGNLVANVPGFTNASRQWIRTAATTLWASWIPHTYTINFNANGGAGAPAAQTKTHGVNLTLSNVHPTRNSTVTFNANGGAVTPANRVATHNFLNWNTNSAGTGRPYSPGAIFTHNGATTLFAQWGNPQFGDLPTPIRYGYDFNGWYTTDGVRVTNTTPVTGNITLYARWSQITYTLTLNPSGGTGVPSDLTKIHGVPLTLPIPVRSSTVTFNANGGDVTPESRTLSHTFLHWQATNGDIFYPGDNYTANEATTMTAQWNNPVVGALPIPKRDRYTFVGWYTAVTGGTRVTNATVITGNTTTFFARWSPDYATNWSELQRLIERVPTTIEISTNFFVPTRLDGGVITIPADVDITLISDNSEQERTLTQTNRERRHFIVEGTLTLDRGIRLSGGADNNHNDSGGIVVRGGTLRMNDGARIENCRRTAPGGAVSVMQGLRYGVRGFPHYVQGRFYMHGGEIRRNIGQNGGAISAANESVISILGGVIYGNSATNNGGAIFTQNYNNSLMINSWDFPNLINVSDDVVFAENTAGNNNNRASAPPYNAEVVNARFPGALLNNSDINYTGRIGVNPESNPVIRNRTELQNAIQSAPKNEPVTLRIVANFSLATAITIPRNRQIILQSVMPQRAGVLTQTTATNRHFIVENGARLTLENGVTLIGGTPGNANNSGGIRVQNGGEFIMNFGSRIENVLRTGNGGAVETNGIFTMNLGAVIIHCRAQSGGAVFVNSGGEFIMNSGQILSNSAIIHGGAIHISNGGNASLISGQIHGNTARNGGAVWTYDYSTENPVPDGRYESLSVSNNVSFFGNTATNGRFVPPVAGPENIPLRLLNNNDIVYFLDGSQPCPDCEILGCALSCTQSFINWQNITPGTTHNANNPLQHLTTDSTTWNSSFTVRDSANGLSPRYDTALAIRRNSDNANTRLALWTPNLAGSHGLRIWVAGHRGTLNIELRGPGGMSYRKWIEVASDGWVDVPFSGEWFRNGPTEWRTVNVTPEQLTPATHMWLTFNGMQVNQTVYLGGIRRVVSEDFAFNNNVSTFGSPLQPFSQSMYELNEIANEDAVSNDFWKENLFAN